MYMWGHVQGASQWKGRLEDRVAIPQHHVPFAGCVLPFRSSLLPKIKKKMCKGPVTKTAS